MSDKNTDKNQQTLVVLRLGAAHGLRGELKATAFAEDPKALKKYGTLFGPNGAQYSVKSIRENAKGVTICLNEVTTREQADALKGVELSVPRHVLPEIKDEDDFYYADLFGLSVRNLEGKKLGEVHAVHDFGAGDILEIKLNADENGKIKQVMIPFSKAAVPKVDIGAGQITVNEDAAGLKDEKDKSSSNSHDV